MSEIETFPIKMTADGPIIGRATEAAIREFGLKAGEETESSPRMTADEFKKLSEAGQNMKDFWLEEMARRGEKKIDFAGLDVDRQLVITTILKKVVIEEDKQNVIDLTKIDELSDAEIGVLMAVGFIDFGAGLPGNLEQRIKAIRTKFNS